MHTIIKTLLQFVGAPQLVEFDYQDTTGVHHGRCYVYCLFAGDRKVKRVMRSLGYRNVRIA